MQHQSGKKYTDIMESLSQDEIKQETRTFLRERFLRMIASLNGQDANITMYEKAKVSGVIQAMDINVQSLQVSELTTPIGVIPEATLRLSDTICIDVPDVKS